MNMINRQIFLDTYIMISVIHRSIILETLPPPFTPGPDLSNQLLILCRHPVGPNLEPCVSCYTTGTNSPSSRPSISGSGLVPYRMNWNRRQCFITQYTLTLYHRTLSYNWRYCLISGAYMKRDLEISLKIGRAHV